jgi:hypothetical protein
MTRRIGVVVLWLLGAATLWAVPEPGPEEVEGFRRRYAHWRKHPEQLERLRENWQKFQELPEARREQMLKLDHDLHEEPSAAQARLWNVMERYVDWLERLPEKDRKAIAAAPTSAARLTLVRDLRDQK